MSFGTQRQNNVVLTGDSEIKELSRRKAELHADISAFGSDLDAIKKQIQNHKDLTSECEQLSVEIAKLVDRCDLFKSEIKTLEKEKERLESLIEARKIDIHNLSFIEENIEEKKKELTRTTEQLLDMQQRFNKQKELMLVEIGEMNQSVSGSKEELDEILRQIKETRLSMVQLVVEKENKILELNKIKDSVVSALNEKNEIESKISLKKEELLTVKERADSIKAESVKQKILFDEKMRVEGEKIESQKRKLEEREGAASKHEAVLETRVHYLRTVKTRLEGHLGKSIDLNIE